MRIWSGIFFGGIITATLLILGVKPANLPWELQLAEATSSTATPTLGDLSGLVSASADEPSVELHPVSVAETLEALNHRLATLSRENHELRERLDELLELETLEERVVELEQRVPEGVLRAPHAYPFPEQVVFCGESLPLDHPVVFQRFEEEFYRLLVNRHWLMSWMRKSLDVFPLVEEELRKAKLPDDLKYVMTIESGLRARATSGAGAAGYWQFMRPTGKQYGLTRNSTVDERRGLQDATRAAIAYMTSLYEEFGSWPLVLASYNAGENRVRKSIQEQGTSDYYHLMLPQETESYWFRAAAVKVLLQNFEDYDLWLLDDGGEAIAYDTVQIRVRGAKLQLKDLAAAAGLSYRELKSLNPQYRRPFVPKGAWTFRLPQSGAGKAVHKYPGSKVLARGKVQPRSTDFFLNRDVALPEVEAEPDEAQASARP